MDQSILDAITKSLPSMQMEALKVELEKARELPRRLEEIKKLENDNRELRLKNTDLLSHNERLAKENANLELRDKEVTRLQDKLNYELVLKELSCANREVETTKYLFGLAFKNPVFQKSIYDNENTYNPNTGQSTNVNKSFTETTRVQE